MGVLLKERVELNSRAAVLATHLAELRVSYQDLEEASSHLQASVVRLEAAVTKALPKQDGDATESHPTVGGGANGETGASQEGDRAQWPPGLVRRLNGEPCGSPDDCASAHCSDGVCCNTECLGPCQTCRSDTQPGSCIPAVGASCGSPSCFAGAFTPGATCVSGVCVPGPLTSCGPYTCDPATNACKNSCTTNTDCASSTTCVQSKCVGGTRASMAVNVFPDAGGSAGAGGRGVGRATDGGDGAGRVDGGGPN